MSEFDAPEGNRLRDTARTSWTLGIIAVILAMLSPCSYYALLLAALPLGILATMRGREVLASPERDEVSEIYAKTGNIVGLAATIYSLVLLTVMAGFVLLYGGMIALMVTGNF